MGRLVIVVEQLGRWNDITELHSGDKRLNLEVREHEAVCFQRKIKNKSNLFG